MAQNPYTQKGGFLLTLKRHSDAYKAAERAQFLRHLFNLDESTNISESLEEPAAPQVPSVADRTSAYAAQLGQRGRQPLPGELDRYSQALSQHGADRSQPAKPQAQAKRKARTTAELPTDPMELIAYGVRMLETGDPILEARGTGIIDRALTQAGTQRTQAGDTWQIVKDSNGRTYEYNKRTGERRPFGPDKQADDDTRDPVNWQRMEAPDGSVKFWNPQTLEIRDALPAGAQAEKQGYDSMTLKDVQSIYNAEPAVKVFKAIVPAVTNVRAALESDNPAQHQAGIMLFAKAISGGDVVTDADLRQAAASGSIPQQFATWYEKAINGTLTAIDRQNIIRAVNDLEATAYNTLRGYQDRLAPQLRTHNPADVFVSTDRLTQDYQPPASQINATPPASQQGGTNGTNGGMGPGWSVRVIGQ